MYICMRAPRAHAHTRTRDEKLAMTTPFKTPIFMKPRKIQGFGAFRPFRTQKHCKKDKCGCRPLTDIILLGKWVETRMCLSGWECK